MRLIYEPAAGDNRLAAAASIEARQQALLRRAVFLPDQQRLIIEAVVTGRVTRRQLARIAGCHAGTMCRRIRRIAQRLYNPIVIALTEPGCSLPAQYRQVGIEYFLHGDPQTRIASRHTLTTAEVRKITDFIKTWAKLMPRA